jgi:hypothetical protein
MLQSIRKWFAIRSYAKSLGPKLRERYGTEKKYTPAQVKRTIKEGSYNVDYMCYALCMYCDYPSFTEYHRSTGEPCDYNAMRSEIADRFFHGDTSFDASDVVDGGSGWDSAESAGDHGSWGDSGGDTGGCSSDGGGGDTGSSD